MKKTYFAVIALAFGVLFFGVAAYAEAVVDTTAIPITVFSQVKGVVVSVDKTFRKVSIEQRGCEIPVIDSKEPGGCAAVLSSFSFTEGDVPVVGPNDRLLQSIDLMSPQGTVILIYRKATKQLAFVKYMGPTELPKEDSLPAGPVFTICASVTRAENGTQIAVGEPVCRQVPPGLTQGKRGEDVLQLQKKLQEKGLLPSDSVTGFFGPATFNAVKRLQMLKGLPQTGFVGQQTLGVLEKE